MKALKTVKGSGKVRNTLRTLAMYQYEQIKKVKGLMKLTPFERGIMLLMIDKGRDGESMTAFAGRVMEIFKSAYGDIEGIKKFGEFKGKIDAGLKKFPDVKPSVYLYSRLKAFWAYTIGEYVAKSLGTITT